MPDEEPLPLEVTPSEILPEPFYDDILLTKSSYVSNEGNNVNIYSVSESLSQLNLENEIIRDAQKETSPSKNNSIFENEASSTILISCVRCGKKNEIDCNFCGNCGLQIHKKLSIIEPESEESLSPEVSRNIKYHYKRPVFCFGPRGNINYS